ncbi:hypothetical protein LOTGIDRAFT_217102 [Lottia gigantea]|uniref:Alanyl-transfer RNA synthetases family profile domain-containing protein n=1 Tax=Lottia gigantea TaxID=225164 RepID=V4AA51_LOTGI|nr:hypothetical protein LOTGIDRAFT_217102 [Lottia gigantea]ESO91940.1 hypothetical protein LOTGIDRAFT_217102 [Lottia gigantea]
MALSCQKDSYLKELNSKVVCCEKAQCQMIINGKKSKINGFEVILEDTILFPEGGGQPYDLGTLNDIPVLKVTRRGDKAVHFTETDLEVSKDVHIKVDWHRRFDHMQQHTGQHLISALAESIFNFSTTSWNLGEKTSFIELDTPEIKDKDLQQLEDTVNEKILAGLSVTPQLFYDKDDPEWKKASCRGLPADHVGPIRVVRIEDVDNNLCCGTHLSSLSHLQCIKLLGGEKGKKGKTNLVFVAGKRVLDYLGRSYSVEKALTPILNGPLDKQVELADKAIKGLKASQKSCTNLLRDLAVMEARLFNMMVDKPPLYSIHRKEGDNEYMNIIATEIEDDTPCFLTTGEEKGSGMFLLCGPPQFLTQAQKKVMELLEGKGACSGGRLRGKANKLSNRSEVEKYLLNLLSES